MKKLYVKQKLFSASERFTVTDDAQNVCYQIKGSFFEIPKSFIIQNSLGNEIAVIKKKFLSFIPIFFILLFVKLS